MSYNGWSNYETWNVALWLENDEGLYNIARKHKTYNDLKNDLAELNFHKTPDGVYLDDKEINEDEIEDMLAEL